MSDTYTGHINVYVIDGFHCYRYGGSFDIGAGLGGLSNGLPGLPLARRDGVLMSAKFIATFPNELQLAVAHELGHFLGLYHTRESYLQVFDNIDDTPNDDAATEYLMYGQIQGQTLLSAQQGVVLRQSPWLMGVE